jgi:integrase
LPVIRSDTLYHWRPGGVNVASIVKIGERWRALVRRKGHPSYCKTFRTKAAAVSWASVVEGDIDSGRAPRPAVVLGRKLLVQDVIDEYRRLRDHSRPIADSANEHYMLKRLGEGLGTLDATVLTPTDLVDYCTARKAEGAGPYTCNMEVSKLGTVMRYAGASLKLSLPDAAAAARPLLHHLQLIGGGGRRERRPTEDELASVVAWLEREKGAMFARIVRFAVATTLRQGEIERVQRADVDATKRLVLVRDRKHPRRKAGNDEWVPLLEDAWRVLQEQLATLDADEPRVWPISGKTISRYFTEACTALGIPDLHFHDLRHEGTSRLFEEGYQIQEVALVTGHKDWRNLRRYTNLRPEDVHKVKRS